MKKNLLGLSIIWFVVSIALAILLRDASELSHTILVVATTFSYFLCAYSWIKSGSRVVSIYTFFIAYAFLCNCVQSLLYICGVPSEFLTSYMNISFLNITNALRFQLICIAALNIGTCYALTSRKQRVSIDQQITWYKSISNVKTKNDKYLFYLMLVLLAGTFYTAIQIAKVRSTMTYHDWMYEGSSLVNTRFYFMYFFSFLSLRFVFRKQHVLLIYASWLFFIVLFMMLGLRSQAIPYVTMFVITLPITHSGLFRKSLIPLWIVGLFFGVIFLGVISATRTNESVDLSSASTDQGAAVGFYSALADIGSSAKTIGNTMDLCDKGMPHYQSIIYSILVVIPERVFKIPITNTLGVSEAITSPGSYVSHQLGTPGAGFSFVSEAYLNYGWFGWIFILLYGFLIARMENVAYKDFMQTGNLFKITFLLYLAKQIFYARGDLCLGEIYIEYMIFTAIIYKILKQKGRLFSLS